MKMPNNWRVALDTLIKDPDSVISTETKEGINFVGCYDLDCDKCYFGTIIENSYICAWDKEDYTTHKEVIDTILEPLILEYKLNEMGFDNE